MTTANMIKVVCAWCGADLGEKPAGNLPAGAVSHGICPKCYAKQLEDLRKPPPPPKRILCAGHIAARRVTLHVAPGITLSLSPAVNAATLKAALEAINVALSYNDGWDVYRTWRPPGCIRSNEALAGWMAARAEHHEQQAWRNPADAA